MSEFMDRCGVVEMPLNGGSYTWSNLRTDEDSILEKLDRILFTVDWSNSYPKAIGIFSTAIGSDHNPLILLLYGRKKKRRQDFKFESKWLLEEECKKKVEGTWRLQNNNNGDPSLIRKLNKTRGNLLGWSRKTRLM
ncbi:hypothetical protein V6N11_026221 [Hibiscus sabdariffa]|uniref:Endonuclease/exonuclease/phosphatase domain-containing protein n=1 Tax=Hibiscus sabdariffa TaxID=183260 RepID=A0ABR2SV14_9ROSI